MAQGLGPNAASVAARLRTMIERGHVMHGGRLPPERELSTRFGVSRSTVRAALAALESEGTVRREPGRGGGTFALHPNANWPLAGDAFEHPIGPVLERRMGQGQKLAVPAMLHDQGFTAGTRVLRTRIERADVEVAAALELAEGAGVVLVERLRLADARPLSWETMYVPLERFPDLLERGVGGSLWELFETAYGVRFGRITERVEIVLAAEPYAAVLEASLGQPMLRLTRVARDADARPIEYSVDVFRGDRTRLIVEPAVATRPE
ncbi:GntR family transcriptional regulator [Mycetocola reblochoni]|uniref:Predicted transcriptional regulator of N-Acetylglucosamine utilization, GntR family n=2 Tax=Mycetocola reblochoni TaxID=331618 RepID=A0A1R4JXW0_9MICO|nr:GntR family transcriptional regulator [Mycetocola reblochoni]RLP67966.1 GntR family transcriptional regulator [Mycetocola reblochoni]SJN37081.1 Predicted transcriptional regulator of N-Acetylglucosamine utilization, GntR family [Mycetocola reblochoni REB411]